jgi:hypothetical protein
MDILEGVLGGVLGAGAISVFRDYLQKHGGVAGLVAEFEKSGLGAAS